MSDQKDPAKEGESFFRKVVRFVANPTTDWAEINSRQIESRESEYAKSELKAMIERKRRNDFVRKREFDTLRKIRREGLTPEQLNGLAALSNLDDSEVRLQADNAGPDGVKAKIDEIEQQMVGEVGRAPAARRTSPSTQAAALRPSATAAAAMNEAFAPSSHLHAPTVPAALMDQAPATAAAALQPAAAARAPVGAPAVVTMGQGVSPLSPLRGAESDLNNPFAVEVNELAHDPDLDEAVISFANADFEQCERTLQGLIGRGGPRAQHAETWLVLFDLYRATGQQHKFDSLALDYAQQFGWSAPQWFSLPKLVADATANAAEETVEPGTARVEGSVGWVAPAVIDADAVTRLQSQLLQLPLPWVLDWSPARQIDAEAANRLRELLQGWADQPLEMRWLGGDKLLSLLNDLAPTGGRDADPEFWLLKLEVLRLTNRPDQFDEVAIDYCVTYEVSPPSWTPSRCSVRVSGAVTVTAAQLSHISDVSSSFMESEIEDEGLLQVASVELSGQLVGDISALLKRMEGKLGSASIVNVSCSKLIRIDFIAAGDLLNWVLARRSESRAVNFEDANRLVALFCGAMGINEHARVKVRNV
jgi:hypothetical protein